MNEPFSSRVAVVFDGLQNKDRLQDHGGAIRAATESDQY